MPQTKTHPLWFKPGMPAREDDALHAAAVHQGASCAPANGNQENKKHQSRAEGITADTWDREADRDYRAAPSPATRCTSMPSEKEDTP